MGKGPGSKGAGAGGSRPATAPCSPPTIMVPPVWVRRGLSTFLCTRKLGRKMTGGISVMVATAKDHCGERHGLCGLPLPDGPEAADSLWTSFGAPGGLQASAAPWVRNGGPPTVAELQAQHRDAHNRVFLKRSQRKGLVGHGPQLPSCV